VTFTITVAGPSAASPTPTGTITATLLGPIAIGTAALDSSGKAVIVVPNPPSPLMTFPWGLPAGSDNITFDYSGDSKYRAAQTKFVQWVNKANSKTTAAVKGSGQPEQLVATVSIDEPSASSSPFSLPGNLSSSSPTGTVQFFNGTVLIGSAPLTSSGLFTSSALLPVAVTPASLTAVYAGDNNYNGSTSSPVTGGGKGTVALTVASSVNPSTFAQPVTFTVAVAPSSGSTPIPTGTVSVSLLGLFTLGSTTLDSSGKGSLVVPGASVSAIPWGLPAGTNSIAFSYSGDASYDAAQTTFSEIVNKAATATAAAITGPIVTATVSISEPSVSALGFAIPGAPAGSADPSGVVQFLSGNTVVGTAVLSPAGLFQSTASLSLPALASSASIIAVYSGDSDYIGSTSPAATIPTLPSVAIAVQSSSNSSTFAEPVTLSFTVTGAAAVNAIPTGTVRATVLGSDVLGSATLDSSGKASIVVPLQTPYPYSLGNLPWGLATGSNAIDVTYSGDVNFAAGQTVFNQAVNQAASQTTVLLAPAANPVNQATVVATVSIDESSVSKVDFRIPAPGTLNTSPTGTVQFFDGTTLLGSAPLNPGIPYTSTATFTAATLPADLRAVYAGDINYTGSSSPTDGKGNGAVTVTLQSSANPTVYGAAFTVLATVVPATAGGPTPTGTVEFSDASQSLGWATTLDSSGNAALQFPIPLATPLACLVTCPSYDVLVLGGGSHAIAAQYSGDANYAAATTTSPLTQQISKAPSNTTVAQFSAVDGLAMASNALATVSDAQPPKGGPYHFQAMTSAGEVDGDPSGTVTFYNGATQVGTGTLAPSFSGNVSSNATLITTGLTSIGSISASYPGDVNFQASSSPTAASSRVGLSASPNPSSTGQSVTLTATVLTASTAPAPTGQVTFFDGNILLGTVAVSGGIATLGTNFTTAGTHSLSAAYSGDQNYQESASPTYTQTVNGSTVPTDSLKLTVSAAMAAYGQQVVLYAQVAGNIATPPSGTVTFLDGQTAVGTGMLSQGSTYAVVTLDVGTHSMSATWPGDSNWPAAQSAAVTLKVNRALTAVTLKSFGTAWTAVVVALPPGAGTPTGTVQFVDTVTQEVLATGTLSNGSTTVTLANAVHLVEALYSGDADFNAGKSRPPAILPLRTRR
jgi:hypothetical protein